MSGVRTADHFVPPIPTRPTDGHKGTFGRVAVVGGRRGMAGSVALSAMAALRSGSGLVTAVVPDAILDTVASFHPALMTIADDQDASGADDCLRRCDAIAVGPGMGTDAAAASRLDRAFFSDVPKVIDADAINVLASRSDWWDRLDGCVLTPHPGEWQRMTNVPADHRHDQIDAASAFASAHRCVVVLKGGPTVVISPSNQPGDQPGDQSGDQSNNQSGVHVWTNATGNPGMATAGSGDVLTGVLVSLIGVGMSPSDAAKAAVHHHGDAGDRAAGARTMASVVATDLIDHLRIA